MAFTTRVKETGQVFQAAIDMGADAKENRVAALPIQQDHTYSGHLFDAYVTANAAPRILRYSGYEQGTFEGRELEEISFDRMTLVPKR
jgi:hypothetical protein